MIDKEIMGKMKNKSCGYESKVLGKMPAVGKIPLDAGMKKGGSCKAEEMPRNKMAMGGVGKVRKGQYDYGDKK